MATPHHSNQPEDRSNRKREANFGSNDPSSRKIRKYDNSQSYYCFDNQDRQQKSPNGQLRQQRSNAGSFAPSHCRGYHRDFHQHPNERNDWRGNSSCRAPHGNSFGRFPRKRGREYNSTEDMRPPFKFSKVHHRDKSGVGNIQGFSSYEIKEFLKLPPTDLVSQLAEKIKDFQCTLANKRLLDQPHVMDAIITILARVSNPQILSNEASSKNCVLILGEVLSERCALFQFSLKMYINRQDCTGNEIEHVCEMFHYLLLALPDISKSCLPVEDLQNVVKKCTSSGHVNNKESLLESMNTISVIYDAARSQSSQLNQKHSCCRDLSEYRKIEIFPQWAEICFNKKPELEKNIIKGGYYSWLHYYDVQFRLLREDFLAPLRKGVCEYLKGVKGRKLKNVRVYNDVHIKEPEFVNSGVCYKIQLHISKWHRRINWEHSKRLLYGSLLCFSPKANNFNQEVYFATVLDRDSQKLKHCGEIKVVFKRAEKIFPFSCRTIPFTMVESNAYFEASQHILRSLQIAEVEVMPFKKYLIDGDCSSVKHPVYHTENTLFDLGFLFKPNKLISKSFPLQNFEDFKKFLNSHNLIADLDDSQLKGLHMALTQEIAVIQGPPGTGKTYIGLKIVEALLKNSDLWNPAVGAKSPILVMCFSNHALDQFLEGILNCSALSRTKSPKLVRIGKRSKNQKLAEYNITQQRSKVFIPPAVIGGIREAEEDVRRCAEALQWDISLYFGAKNFDIILTFDQLKKYEVILPNHEAWLCNCAHTELEVDYALELWLGLVTPLYQEDALHFLQSEIPLFVKSIVNKTSDDDADDDDDEQTQSGSFIEVQGEAVIEQSERLLDDDFHFNQEYEQHHLVSDIKTKYYERLEYVNHEGSRNFRFNKDHAQEIFRITFSLPPMSKKEVQWVNNIFSLSYCDRWRLYKHWHTEYLQHCCRGYETKFVQYRDYCSVLEEAKKQSDRFVLESAEVIGMTTTGAAKYQHILHLVKPKIVIVEEAAEVLESHIVSALNAGTQHLILIGDHKQLRPKPNEYELAVKYNLHISLFERLIRNGIPHATLEYQHRMRPEIAELVKPHIYSTLSNHSSVEKYPNIRGVSTNLFFINHDCEEQEDENLMSHSNNHEAKYLVGLCHYLLQQCYSPSQITILVTYSGQLLAMRKLMPKLKFDGVRICTVDNFQGEENDIILLSLVRSNKEKNVGFLQEENRICVALSRAKHGFYCIGNFSMFREKVLLWEDIMADMEQKGKLGQGLFLQCSNHPKNSFTAKDFEDFEKYAPEGGCQLDCDFRLNCGHACTQKCHYTDREHKEFRCMKPCQCKCSKNHKCPDLCYETCICKVRVVRKMPDCSHKQVMYCYEDPKTIQCKSKCLLKCKNDHPCKKLCYERCGKCLIPVMKTLPQCQHEQKVECFMNPEDVKCTAKCPKQCVNGHPCLKTCGEECGKCQVQVLKTIPVCNHILSMLCFMEPQHCICEMPCEKTLSCGHKCQQKCGAQCNYFPCKVEVTKELPDCRHKQKLPCHASQYHTTCQQKCERTLPCGHLCDQLCSDRCQTECQVLISKSWPCGHNLKRTCYKVNNPEMYPCTSRCDKVLECGHRCSRKCGEPCACYSKVLRDYPCGHKLQVYCSSTPSDFPCDQLCSSILTCGHKCSGRCSDCTKMHVHNLCPRKVTIKRFCGHSFTAACSGLSDTHPGNRDFPVKCCHKIKKSCSDAQLHNCREACQWNCTHFWCTKPCFEKCDRPRCEERCPQKLKCGHQCYGVCGEPCLTACPKCSSKNFKRKLRIINSFKPNILYYELSCRHIFPVKYLDEYVGKFTNLQSHVPICPIKCPVEECPEFFNCCFRYGNAVKQQLFYMQIVTDLIQLSPRSPHDAKNILLFRELRKLLSSESINDSHLRNLQEVVLASFEGKYLVHMFIEVMKIIEVLNEIPEDTSPYCNSTWISANLFTRHLSERIYERKTELSCQVALDIKSEVFRLYLFHFILLSKYRATSSSNEQSTQLCANENNTSLSSEDSEPDHPASFVVSYDRSMLAIATPKSDDATLPDIETSPQNDNKTKELTSDSISATSLAIAAPKSDDATLPDIETSPPNDNKTKELTSDPTRAISTSEKPVSPTPCSDSISAIAAAEKFVKDVLNQNLQVTKIDIQTHCSAIGNRVDLDPERMLKQVELFYPAVQKGQWWRCPTGEFYCIPPSFMDKNGKDKCPKCGGLHESVEKFFHVDMSEPDLIGKQSKPPQYSLKETTVRSAPSKHKEKHHSPGDKYTPQSNNDHEMHGSASRLVAKAHKQKNKSDPYQNSRKKVFDRLGPPQHHVQADEPPSVQHRQQGYRESQSYREQGFSGSRELQLDREQDFSRHRHSQSYHHPYPRSFQWQGSPQWSQYSTPNDDWAYEQAEVRNSSADAWDHPYHGQANRGWQRQRGRGRGRGSQQFTDHRWPPERRDFSYQTGRGRQRSRGRGRIENRLGHQSM